MSYHLVSGRMEGDELGWAQLVSQAGGLAIQAYMARKARKRQQREQAAAARAAAAVNRPPEVLVQRAPSSVPRSCPPLPPSSGKNPGARALRTAAALCRRLKLQPQQIAPSSAGQLVAGQPSRVSGSVTRAMQRLAAGAPESERRVPTALILGGLGALALVMTLRRR